MAFLYDYILALDVSRLPAAEVSQCLLYLRHLSRQDAEMERGSAGIRGRLQDRLAELRREKDSC